MLIPVVLFLLFSCGGEQPAFIAEKDLTPEEKQQHVTDAIRTLLDEGWKDEALKYDTLLLATGKKLVDLYSGNGYKSFFSRNGEATKQSALMLSALDSAWSYGFNPEWYYNARIKALLDSAENDKNFVTKSKLLAAGDVLLTNACMLYSVHLSKGMIDTTVFPHIAWKTDSAKIDFLALLNTGENEFLKKLYSYQPKNIEYRRLQAALSKYMRKNEPWDDHFEIPDAKKDSVGFWKTAKDVLVKMKLIDTASLKTDSLVTKAYLEFQRMHAIDMDAKAGKQSAASLRKSNYDRFLQAALSLEKWRWKNTTRDLFFRVNIPSYTLTVTRNDSILRTHNVVTGAVETKTPEFSAKIKWITLFPYWHVPHSISTTEFLWAAQRDTGYIKRNGYVMLNKGNEAVKISDVNFKNLSRNNFPYKVRQNGGWGNSLGLIVFHFPNKHDVYMHDTPAKYLFKRSVRAFSHGCMRLENPFSLGEFVMKNERPNDTITSDTLKAWALRGYEQRLVLKKQIPIEVDYITCTADSLGNIYFHLDIYGRDEKYVALMRKFGK